MGRKIIGIMGGMGPDATVDLYNKIIEETRRRGAVGDQDHLEVVISSVPQTPDRTEAIFGKAPSPVPEMIRSARRLEAAGAGFIAIACNSAHYFYAEISSSVTIPVLHMIRLTVAHTAGNYPNAGIAGILATDGTLKTRLYHDALEKEGIEPLVLDLASQETVMDAIYGEGGIKAEWPSQRATTALVSAANRLVEQGAAVIIIGCTEIPLALRHVELAVPVVESTDVLAGAAVTAALGSEGEL